MYSKYFCAPAWTIARRHVDLNAPVVEQDKAPPPGHYHPNDFGTTRHKNGPAWTIQDRKGAKDQRNKLGDPGPGKYNISRQPKSAGVAFTKSSRDGRGNDKTPGPGHYHNQAQQKRGASQGYTMSGKPSEPTQSKTPGPQTYKVQGTVMSRQAPQISFGKSARGGFQNKKYNNGPGTYQISHNIFQPPKISFSKAPRSTVDQNAQFAPGPGQYNNNKQINSKSVSKGCVFSKSSKVQIDAHIPGPGQYDITILNQKKKVGSSFGKSKRIDLGQGKGTPGPGQYKVQGDILKNKHKSTTSMKSSRLDKTDKFASPGPGTYQIQKKIEGPKYSISGNKPRQVAQNIPGPGQYNINSYKSKRPQSAKIGTGQRGTLKNSIQAPGPGHYNMIDDGVSPSWGFGRQVKRQRQQWTPGPGHYNIKPLVGQQPGYVYGNLKSKVIV